MVFSATQFFVPTRIRRLFKVAFLSFSLFAILGCDISPIGIKFRPIEEPKEKQNECAESVCPESTSEKLN
jgi:hypothetical protein